MKKVGLLLCFIVACGCAKVNIATSKPIKVDINMRVDVYQHVAKDVESIEDQIYGAAQKQINSISIFENAYAQEAPAELSLVIQKRRERSARIEEFFAKGYIGENSEAYLEVLSKNLPQAEAAGVQAVVSDENSDRKVIYSATAKKNGADISSVEKAFFDDHYKRAASGWWFKVRDQATGSAEWKQK